VQIALPQFDCSERRRRIEVQNRKHGGNRAPGQPREDIVVAAADIVTIVPQGKRNAALLARCQTFTELEVEFAANEMAANNVPLACPEGTWPAAKVAARSAEVDRTFDYLCRSRARTLNGIRVRRRRSSTY